ncbi:MAG: alpha/beta fold hydrolase [Dehalococcoidia bacterium]
MEHIPIPGGGSLDAWFDGGGEPVLFIHGSLIAGTFECLRGEPVLADSFELITYSRRGYAGSARYGAGVTVEAQVRDAIAVLDYFGVRRAHVVGHSSGGMLALHLHRLAPKRVHTLALLEPPLFDVPAGSAEAAYREGDHARAAAIFLDLVFGDGPWRGRVDRNLPVGWLAQTVADLPGLFEVELHAPAAPYGAVEASNVTAPVLSVLGAESPAPFGEGQALMRGWWPGLETALIPGVSHDLHFGNPHAVAEALAAFFRKHPFRPGRPVGRS